MSAQEIAVGDTLKDIPVVAGVIAGVKQDMTDAGWVCTARLITSSRTALTAARQITATVADTDGKQAFYADMLKSESEQMTIDAGQDVAIYYWSVQVESTTQNFRAEQDYELRVRSNAVT